MHVLTSDQLNAYDVVVSDDIVFSKAAFEAFVAQKTGATRRRHERHVMAAVNKDPRDIILARSSPRRATA